MVESKKVVTKFTIYILEGYNVSSDIWDKDDTPNSQLVFNVPQSTEKVLYTILADAKDNPVWNDVLTFHVNARDEQEIRCEITLLEDRIFRTVERGKFVGLLHDLGESISFPEGRIVKIKVDRKVIHIDSENSQIPMYNLYRTVPKPVKVVKIQIKEGRNITKGIRDIDEKPNIFVEVRIKFSAEGKERTSTIETTDNPTWNKSLTFHYDPNIEEEVMCEFSLNYVDTKNSKTEKILYPVTAIPSVISFENDRHIILDVQYKMQNSDLLDGTKLSDAEIEFCQKRKQVVFESLKSVLGDRAPNDIYHVPNIAIVNSGGGFRAMTAVAGAMNAFEKLGLLDCVMYNVALSGSTWYLFSLYTHPHWPYCSTNVISQEIKQQLMKAYNPFVLSKVPDHTREIIKKFDLGLKWSLADFLGYSLGEHLLPDRLCSKWSNIQSKIAEGAAAMPITTCMRAYTTSSAKEFQEWIEISPFEVVFPKYGVAIKTENFTSRFFQGTMYEHLEEPPVHFLEGVCGSGYVSQLDKIPNRFNEQIRVKYENHPWFSALISSLEKKHLHIKSSIIEYLESREVRTSFIPDILHRCYLEPIFHPTFNPETNAKASKVWRQLPKTTNDMSLIDAGLDFNIPHQVVMNPKREVDLIITFECSHRGSDQNQPFEELLAAEKWARSRNIKFPPIDINEEEEVRELYIFEDKDDVECPVIMHFVLINKEFRNFIRPGVKRETTEDEEFANFDILDDMNNTYGSGVGVYTEKAFDRLRKLMEFIVLNNEDKIKENILKAIEKRKRGLKYQRGYDLAKGCLSS